MPLSEQLKLLHEFEPSYKGHPGRVGSYIANARLHMVEGATNSGKTTVIDRLVEISGANAVPSRTDRPRKYGDPLRYETASEGYELEDIIADIDRHDVVNYAIFPTGRVYATYPHHYTAIHNYLPTMVENVPQLTQANFLSTDESYVYLVKNAWKSIVHTKTFDGQRKARMEEAVISYEYAIEHANDIAFVKNRLGQNGLARAARTLLAVTVAHDPGDDKDRAIADIIDLRDYAKKQAFSAKAA